MANMGPSKSNLELCLTDIPASLRCKQIANVGKSYILHNQNTIIYRDKKKLKGLIKGECTRYLQNTSD